MKYRVFVEPGAKQDFSGAIGWIARHSEAAARLWLEKFEHAIQTPRETPLRCPLSPESELFQMEIRQMFFGRRHSIYRILFIIDGKSVRILHVRHGSRDTMNPASDKLAE